MTLTRVVRTAAASFVVTAALGAGVASATALPLGPAPIGDSGSSSVYSGSAEGGGSSVIDILKFLAQIGQGCTPGTVC